MCIGLTISIESTSVQNPHSSNDQVSCKTSQVQDQRYIFRHGYESYTKFWLSNAWCLKYVIIRNKVIMWYAQGRQSNKFSHASKQPQNIMGMYGFQSAYQYEALDVRNSVFFHTLSEEIYDARLLNFPHHDMWTVSNPRYPVFHSKIP